MDGMDVRRRTQCERRIKSWKKKHKILFNNMTVGSAPWGHKVYHICPCKEKKKKLYFDDEMWDDRRPVVSLFYIVWL